MLDLNDLRVRTDCVETCRWSVVPHPKYADQAQLRHEGMVGEIKVMALDTLPLDPDEIEEAVSDFLVRVGELFHEDGS